MLEYILALKLSSVNIGLRMKMQTLLCALRNQAAEECGLGIKETQDMCEEIVLCLQTHTPYPIHLLRILKGIDRAAIFFAPVF